MTTKNKMSLMTVVGVLGMLLGYTAAEASGMFIPPRPPAIKKPGASKCEPADSDKCKAEKK